MRCVRLTHVITGLPVGGAQRMLAHLVRRLPADEFDQDVVSLTRRGPVGRELAAGGIEVTALGGGYGPAGLIGFGRLARRLRNRPVDLLQTWLYHADLAGGLAAAAARLGRGEGPAVVWGIRHSDLRDLRPPTRWVARACARLSSRLPDRIVCNSREAREVHAGLGYERSRMLVIPNGFDLDRFRPDPDARREVRRELGVAPEAPLVGMAAEVRLQKDHRAFVEAAARLADADDAIGRAARFLLCGRGTAPRSGGDESSPGGRDGGGEGSERLGRWIREAGLEDRIHRLGVRSDMPRVLAALDVATLTSRSGESFPTVVGEALACGVPVVATDVGDTARIVGEAGRVVAPGRPEALAAGWREILSLSREEREALGRAGQRRIRDRYSVASVVSRYAELYREVAGEPAGQRPGGGGGSARGRGEDPDR